MGFQAGAYQSKTNRTSIGSRSKAGNYSVAVGKDSSNGSSTDYSVLVGNKTAQYTTGANNVAVGYEAGLGVTGASTFANTVAVGYQALTALTTGAGNTAVGYQASTALTTGNQNTTFGYEAGLALSTGSKLVALGYQAGSATTGSTSDHGQTFVGYRAGLNMTSGAQGAVAIGSNARGKTNGSWMTVVGSNAYSSNTNGTAIGSSAKTKGYGVSVGTDAGNTNAGGTYIGYNSGGNNGSNNTVVGGSAGKGSGSYNVSIGESSGSSMTTGASNVLVGYSAGSTLTTESNKLYIENSNSTTPLIYGEFDNDILRVNGTLQVNDPASTGYALPAATGTTGQALVVNASGDVEFGDVGVDGFSTYVDPSDDDIALWQSEVGQTLVPWGSAIGNEEYQPRATFLSPDGSKFFFLGDYQNPDEIFQYTLNTPYDLSTIDSSTKVEVVFLGSGALGGRGQESNTYGLHIANDPADTSTYGKRFYIIGSGKDEVQEYTATTAWDLSTINTTATAKFYVGNQDGNPSNLRFSPDGTKFFVVDFDSNVSIDVRQYDMSTAWDITTASHNASKDVLLNTLGSRSTGLDFNLDGSKVFLIGSDNAQLHQYSLSTNYDLTTASLDKIVSMDNFIAPLNNGSRNYQGGLYYDRNSDYVYITRWHVNLIYRVNRNTAKITSQVSFDKGLIAENGLYVKNHAEFSSSLHSSSLNTGGITCGQVNFSSLFNGAQFYTTTGQMHIMSPYLRFAQQYNSSYGIKLIPDLSVRNNQAVDVALPTQSGKIKVDTELYYVGRYDSEAAAKLTSTSDTEIYYTARADGEGNYSFSISENPTSGQTIQRDIYYSDKAFADPATSGDWTQLTSFSGSGASFNSTKTEAYNQLNNRTVGTVPLSIKTTISNAVTSSLRNDVFKEMDLALGLRLLNPNYTGACIRVENDSNVEADIGFVNGVIDTTSLLSHCGSGDGYVVKIYDQSQGGATGSGNDATHANNSLSVNKPQIVSSGSVLLENGKPCMSIEECQFLLDSQKDYYADFNLNMVVSSEMTASNQGMIIGDSGQRDVIWFNSGTNIQTRLDGSQKNFSFSGVYATTRNMGQLTLSMWKESDNGVYLYVNNASSVSSNSTSNHFGVYRLFNGWNNTAYDFVGKFQELVFWGSALSAAERALAESNINTYYSIY